MWGNILTEVSFQPNFNIGFSNTRSDVLIHLTQWQYWWWFWFTFVWVLYYLIISRIVRYRLLKFRPRLATTLRPRGKWGDLLVCLIPISWCINILINSNFLLKLIEWQNESGLFTLRIRGRQWYWIYKFDLKNVTDILAAPKNIGRNKWNIYFHGDMQTADDYLHILQLRSQNRWIKKYWNDFFNKNNKVKKFHVVSAQENYKRFLKVNYNRIFLTFFLYHENFFFKTRKKKFYFSESSFNLSSKTRILNSSSIFNLYENLKFRKLNWTSVSNFSVFNYTGNESLSGFFGNNVFFLSRKKQLLDKKSYWDLLTQKFNGDKTRAILLHNHPDFDEISRFYKRSTGPQLPVRLIKYPLTNLLNDNFYSRDVLELIRFRFNNTSNKIEHKIMPHTTFLTLKQKRYKRRKVINPFIAYYKDNMGKRTKNIKYSGKLYLKNNSIFTDDLTEPTQYYRMLKKNKKRFESIPVVYSKRMLRTQRTLVLPAHVNITAITNSYDVVHSWFIPGLGIKIDCIPGRATHHTFYVDNVGFYYGQCAEICGRYHHHMPIRICALPFEHFLVWWHSFGLPKLLFTNNQKRFESYYAFRKYVW